MRQVAYRRWLALAVIFGIIPLGVTQAQVGTMAKLTPLAKQQAENLSGQSLAWIADRLNLPEAVTHQHEIAFVYADGGPATLAVGDQTTTIDAGKGAAVSTAAHTHGPGTFMEIRLAAPDTQPHAGSTRVFASEALQSIPAGTVNLQFVDVVLPPSGGQTSVHSHPGPETIYVRAGPLEYQSSLHGTETLPVGTARSLPPNTAVQKRNPTGQEAAFLALFVVDPSQPFAPETTFQPAPAAQPAVQPAQPAPAAEPPAQPVALPNTGGNTQPMWAGLALGGCVLLTGILLRLASRRRSLRS